MKIITSRALRLASVLIATTLALSSIANAQTSGSTTHGGAANAGDPFTAINATLSDDMRMTLDRYTATAGVVRFYVTNAGQETHELVVLKTDLPANALTASQTVAGKVEENLHMGETGDVAAGRFNGLELRLGVGHYVILCNEIGHYMAGMRVDFTVTAPVVSVSLDDHMAITLDRTTFYAGPIVFAVTNRGAVTHELVILATNATADQIPANPEETGKVAEDANIGETGDIPAPRFSGLGIELQPGTYMLICNEPGHFASGMHIQITVLPAPGGDE